MAKQYWLIGASSGIGRALALELLKQGHHVALTARRQSQLDEIAAGYPQQTRVLPADVTVLAELQAAFTALTQDGRKVDSVIMNAADYEPMRLEDFDPELFARLMQVNFQGVVNGIATVREYMQQNGGEIAITASVAGYRGLPYAAPYGASKAALINMAESLAPEFARYGVAIRVINPGFVRTALTEKNNFAMPGRIEPEQAAALIAKRLQRGGFELLIPRGFGLLMKLIRLMPNRLFLALTAKALKPQGESPKRD
ncbi:MAG TPA: SDR family NAD(P)-dependent oxidoreductase [Halothiobacillaceae bacterium]|nr:SDR family NAD(P)-dependent oxidoreductase [Halothiobacillaceae bacterium]